MSSTKLDTAYSWPFKNVGTESIPAFGAMRVTGFERDSVQGLFLTVEPPDDTEDDPVAINSGVAVDDGRWGVCFFPQAAWAKVEEATEHGDKLGAEKDKAGLVKDGGDYTQIGEKDTDLDAVLVSVLGGGVSVKEILLTETVAGATWNSSLKKLTPVEFTAKLWTPLDDGGSAMTYNDTAGEGEVEGLSYYVTDVTVGTGKGRFGYLQNGELLIGDCEEIILEEEDPPA